MSFHILCDWSTLFLLAVLVHPVAASTFDGRTVVVADSETQQPIAGAVVRIPSVNLLAITNSRGICQIEAVIPDSAEVTVRSLGYYSSLQYFELSKDTLIVYLKSSPLMKPGVTVTRFKEPDAFIRVLAEKLSSIRQQCAQASYKQAATLMVDVTRGKKHWTARQDAISSVSYNLLAPESSYVLVDVYRNLGIVDTADVPIVDDEIYDVFSESITILKYPYPSPLSPASIDHYVFQQIDCAEHTECCIQYYFEPRIASAPGFKGVARVCQADTSIIDISMRLVNPYQFNVLDSANIYCLFDSQEHPWFPVVNNIELWGSVLELVGLSPTAIHATGNSIASDIQCNPNTQDSINAIQESLLLNEQTENESGVVVYYNRDSQNVYDPRLPRLDSAEVELLRKSHEYFASRSKVTRSDLLLSRGFLLYNNPPLSVYAGLLTIRPSSNVWLFGARASIDYSTLSIGGHVYSDLYGSRFGGYDLTYKPSDSLTLTASYSSDLLSLQNPLYDRLKSRLTMFEDIFFYEYYQYYKQEVAAIGASVNGKRISAHLLFGLSSPGIPSLKVTSLNITDTQFARLSIPYIATKFRASTGESKYNYQSELAWIEVSPLVGYQNGNRNYFINIDLNARVVINMVNTVYGPVNLDIYTRGSWASLYTPLLYQFYSGRRIPFNGSRQQLLTSEVGALGGRWGLNADSYLRLHDVPFRLFGLKSGHFGLPSLSISYGVGLYANTLAREVEASSVLIHEAGIAIDRVPVYFTDLFVIGAEARWPVFDPPSDLQSFGWIMRFDFTF
jgi:hypothetical protein